MIIAVSSCNNEEIVNNIEPVSIENEVIDINESTVDSEERIEYTELEGQPDY